MQPKIFANVKIGSGEELGLACLIGLPPRGRQEGELLLQLGSQSTIRAFSVVYSGSTIGDQFQTGTHVTIRENNVIGNDVAIGTKTSLEIGNRIGNRVRIHGGCFLELATVGDDVFIGPNVTMIDDPHPPCPKYQECKGGVVIGAGVKIGAGAILMPGITIGSGSLIGAGSLVTRDIPRNVVVAGHPAKVIKPIDELECPPGFFNKPYHTE